MSNRRGGIKYWARRPASYCYLLGAFLAATLVIEGWRSSLRDSDNLLKLAFGAAAMLYLPEITKLKIGAGGLELEKTTGQAKEVAKEGVEDIARIIESRNAGSSSTAGLRALPADSDNGETPPPFEPPEISPTPQPCPPAGSAVIDSPGLTCGVTTGSVGIGAPAPMARIVTVGEEIDRMLTSLLTAKASPLIVPGATITQKADKVSEDWPYTERTTLSRQIREFESLRSLITHQGLAGVNAELVETAITIGNQVIWLLSNPPL